MTRRVVIGYDGSDVSEDALGFGLTWCRSTGDVPVVATVYPEEHALGLGRVDAEWAAYVREQAELTQQKARAAGGERALYRAFPSSSASHGLADIAEDADAALIVVGRSASGGLARSLLGSSTERLLHGATLPVTVVPPGWRHTAPDRISRVGVAYIDTRDAREALRVAVRDTLRLRAQLTLYTVVGGSTERFSYLAGRREEEALYAKVLESFRTALELAAAGVPTELERRAVLLEGDVVDTLAGLGPDDIDVLFCGSRSYGPVRRVMLGGVSSRLTRQAQLPITVVPRAGAAAVE